MSLAQLNVCFAAINLVLLVYLIIKKSDFRRNILNRRLLIPIVIIIILGISIRLISTDFQFATYIDEHWYADAGRNIIMNGELGSYPKSVGWPLLIGISYILFGLSINSIMLMNITLWIGCSILLFCLIHDRFKSIKTALAISISFMFLPATNLWATTGDNIIASLFFLILTIKFFFSFTRGKSALPMFAAAAFAALIRPENFLLLPILMFGAILYKKMSKKILVGAAIFILLTAPNFMLDYTYYKSQNWITDEDIDDNISLINLKDNTFTYGKYVLSPIFFPWTIIILTIIGLVLIKDKRMLVILLIIFLSYYLLYFSAWIHALGGNSNPIYKSRLLLTFYPIILVFASISIHRSLKKLRKDLPKIIFVILIVFSSMLMFNDIWLKHPTFWLETHLPDNIKPYIGPNCTVVATQPIIISSTNSFKVTSINNFKNLDETCSYFIEDYYCITHNEFGSFNSCNQFIKEHNLNVISEFRYGDVTYVLYEIV